MRQQNDTATPTAIGAGGKVVSNAVTSRTYHQNTSVATESTYPVITIASRFGLTMALAGEVVRMAGIGGRLA